MTHSNPPTLKALTRNTRSLAAPKLSASLRKNFSGLVTSNAVYALCQWGILVTLTKLTSPAMVGHFALAQALTAPVFLLANLSLRTIQATDVRYSYSLADYMGLRLLTTPIALCAVVGFAAAVYPTVETLIIAIVALGKAFDAISDTLWGEMQRNEQMLSIATGMILNGILSLSLVTLAALLTRDVLWAVLGSTVASVLVLVGYNLRAVRTTTVVQSLRKNSPNGALIPRLRRVLPRLLPRSTFAITRIALPLGVAAALSSLFINVPRYFLEHEYGSFELGIFAAISYFMVAGNTVMNAASQSMLPLLSRCYAAHDRESFTRLLIRLAAVGLVIALLALLATRIIGRKILTLLYNEEYGRHDQILLLLMVATAISFLSWAPDYGMSAAQRFKTQLMINAATTAVVVAASAVLIPGRGLRGAAWAMVVAMLVYTLTKTAVIVRTVQLMPDHSAEGNVT